MQVMAEKDAAKLPYHPFDLTKVWLHKDCPLIDVGVMELNAQSGKLFRGSGAGGFQSRQPSCPGIGGAPDKMLQRRLVLIRL